MVLAAVSSSLGSQQGGHVGAFYCLQIAATQSSGAASPAADAHASHHADVGMIVSCGSSIPATCIFSQAVSSNHAEMLSAESCVPRRRDSSRWQHDSLELSTSEVRICAFKRVASPVLLPRFSDPGKRNESVTTHNPVLRTQDSAHNLPPG